MSENRPRTQRELAQSRRLELRKFATEYIEKWVVKNPHMAEISYPVASPVAPFPMNYNKNPQIRTKTDLEASRKLELSKGNIPEKHEYVTLGERVREREKKKIVILNSQNITRSLFRKKKDLEHLEQKFSKCVTGVHGSELPKFSENCKDYWKLKQGYTECPRVRTCYSETRPVSEHYCLRSSSFKQELPLKPTELNPFPNFEVTSELKDLEKRPPSRPRFTQEFYVDHSYDKIIPIDPEKTDGMIRPQTAIMASMKVRKERPHTAYTVKLSTSDHSTIRSRGFNNSNNSD